eukprot:10012895-Alexandrium_andersonii.AAC.1
MGAWGDAVVPPPGPPAATCGGSAPVHCLPAHRSSVRGPAQDQCGPGAGRRSGAPRARPAVWDPDP